MLKDNRTIADVEKVIVCTKNYGNLQKEEILIMLYCNVLNKNDFSES